MHARIPFSGCYVKAHHRLIFHWRLRKKHIRDNPIHTRAAYCITTNNRPRLADQASAYIENYPANGLEYYGRGQASDNKNMGVTLHYKTETTYTFSEYPAFSLERTDTEYSLSEYSAFSLEFTEIIGQGTISIDMGFGTASVLIAEAGIITIPFSEWIIPPDSARSFNNITYLTIKWQNITEEARFTLREIAAIQTSIPEPATYATLASLAALSTFTLRRPRRHPR